MDNVCLYVYTQKLPLQNLLSSFSMSPIYCRPKGIEISAIWDITSGNRAETEVIKFASTRSGTY